MTLAQLACHVLSLLTAGSARPSVALPYRPWQIMAERAGKAAYPIRRFDIVIGQEQQRGVHFRAGLFELLSPAPAMALRHIDSLSRELRCSIWCAEDAANTAAAS